MPQVDRISAVCTRLTALGYARSKTIRLYGEVVDLTADPSPEGDDFMVEGIARSSGKLTRIRLPRPVVQVVKRELETRLRVV